MSVPTADNTVLGKGTEPVLTTRGNLRAFSLLDKQGLCFTCRFHLNSSKSKLERPLHYLLMLGMPKITQKTHTPTPLPKYLNL